MKYSPKYFYDEMPDWKRKKDQITARYIYRPISFLLSSVCANLKINANTVSYFSMIIAIVGAGLFCCNNFICAVVGASLINFWLILDCVDGNLARSYKRQPYGEFADAISSYVMVALLCFCMSYYVYCFGGVIVSGGSIYILFFGFAASISDTLMRLVYQKFKSVTNDMIKKGIVKEEIDYRENHNKVKCLLSFVENELGFGGILPLVLVFAVIFNFVDLLVLYCFCYYFGSCFLIILKYIHKARKYKNVPMDNNISQSDEIV